MADFFVYTWSLIWSWLGVLAGAAGAAIALYERAKKQELHPKRYIAILLGFLFIAGFGAWQQEHESRVALDKKVAELDETLKKYAPDIRVTVEDAFAGIVLDGSSKDTGLIFYLAVRNVGQMPSVVDDYGLSLKVPGVGTIAPDKIPLTKAFTLRSPSGEVVQINPSNAIYEKTLRPIPPGGMEKGIFVFIARNVRDRQLYGGADYRLLWRDVTGRVKHLDGCLGRATDFRIPFVPGIEQEHLPKASPTNPE